MVKNEIKRGPEISVVDNRRKIEERRRVVKEGLFDWPSENPSLIGARCKKCKEVFFPKRFICPICFQENTLENIPLSNKGNLYTFCILERGPMGFDPPYAVGYIDLPEGVRIYSILAEADMKKLEIGMEMELVIGPIRKTSDGEEIIGYKFKPVL
jgi:benzoylsuccinyl-CoA thiolase BbsA subunit